MSAHHLHPVLARAALLGAGLVACAGACGTRTVDVGRNDPVSTSPTHVEDAGLDKILGLINHNHVKWLRQLLQRHLAQSRVEVGKQLRGVESGLPRYELAGARCLEDRLAQQSIIASGYEVIPWV